VLHRAGYAATGLSWEYDAHRVAAGGLADYLAGRDGSWRGLSLTMPLKREAVGLVDTLTDVARQAGAANTLVLDAGVRGENTDVPGAAAALAERDVAARTATILGGGATATSVGLALADRGVEELLVLVRDPVRGAETLERLSGSGVAVEVADLATEPVTGDLVVSTIPAAAQDDDLVCRCAGVPAVFEVVYDPWPTPLAAAALRQGQVLVSGLDLLVHQAALQFALFTGLPAPVAAMRAAGEQSLADRMV